MWLLTGHFACYSGPGVEEGVGGEPEEQPDEQPDGRRRPASRPEPHRQLRHGGVLSRFLVEKQRGFGRREESEGRKEVMCLLSRGYICLHGRVGFGVTA